MFAGSTRRIGSWLKSAEVPKKDKDPGYAKIGGKYRFKGETKKYFTVDSFDRIRSGKAYYNCTKYFDRPGGPYPIQYYFPYELFEEIIEVKVPEVPVKTPTTAVLKDVKSFTFENGILTVEFNKVPEVTKEYKFNIPAGYRMKRYKHGSYVVKNDVHTDDPRARVEYTTGSWDTAQTVADDMKKN